MIEEYIGVRNNIYECNVRRSKFIGICMPIQDNVKLLIKEIKAKYKDATHVCYAYRLIDNNSSNVVENCSDDQEPSGTAGLPMLNVLKSFDVNNSIIFVVRYYGGVKLGVAGLIDAYKNTAINCIKDSIVKYKKCNIYNATINYNQLANLQKNKLIKILECKFNDIIDCQFVCSESTIKEYRDISYKNIGECFVEVNNENN